MPVHFNYVLPPKVPNIFGTKDHFCGRQFFHGPGGGAGIGGAALAVTPESKALLGWPTAHLPLCRLVPWPRGLRTPVLPYRRHRYG